MTSSVTTDFNEVFLQEFQNDLDSAGSNYYVGLSRPTELTLTSDIKSKYFQDQARHRLQTIKTLSNSSFVVPRVNWVSASTTFESYDTGGSPNNYYVVNTLDEVFVLVAVGQEEDGRVKPTQDEPTRAKAIAFDPSGLSSRTFTTTDDYRWRYLYTLSNIAVSNFLTTDFVPVKKITTTQTISIPQEELQRLNQDSAVAGEIIGVAIDSAGTGYATTPTITIVGNGSGASFSCDVTGGKIVRVRVDSDGITDSGLFLHGSGYDYASATVSSGDAVLRPIISRKGLNKEPVNTLNASALMLQVDIVGDEFDTILAENDFNQICIFKNLEDSSGNALSLNTANAMQSLDITVTTGGPFAEDELVENGAQTAKGYVFHHDTLNNKLYYWQDETTGFTPFNNAVNDQVAAVAGGSGTTATFSAENSISFNKYSGQMLYINNVGGEGEGTPTLGITKETDQTEDIRIVIQLGS